jgi:hypothetical protein
VKQSGLLQNLQVIVSSMLGYGSSFDDRAKNYAVFVEEVNRARIAGWTEMKLVRLAEKEAEQRGGLFRITHGCRTA